MAANRKTNMVRISALISVGLVTIIIAATACGSDERTLEERAQGIDRSLICPVCPGETIDQSQAQLASQMQAVVREKLAEGQTRAEILQFFVDSYGEGVLAAPPKSGFNLLVWLLPIAGVAGAATVLFFVIRAMRGQIKQPEIPTPDRELEPYLMMVDEELGIQHILSKPEAKPEEKG